MKIHAPLVALFALFLPETGSAQGFIKSYACEPLASPLSVDVQVLDDIPPMLDVRDVVVQRLRTRNVTISENAPLRLLIDPQNLPGQPASAGRNLTRLNQGRGQTLEDRSELSERLDELREQRSQTKSLTPTEYPVSVALTLNAKSDGRCIWQGEARYAEGGDEEYWQTVEKIVVPLVDAIGKAVDNRPFTLP